MRTDEQKQEQIKGLEAMKTWLPENSMFGDPNWAKIDAQVEILKGSRDLADFDEGDPEEEDYDYQLYNAAQEADDWLYSDSEEDLYETE